VIFVGDLLNNINRRVYIMLQYFRKNPYRPLSTDINIYTKYIPKPNSNTMELATEPDVYSPCVDNLGNYIDKQPNFSVLPNGIRCPCGGRKDTYTSSSFGPHMKTKLHKKWLEQMTANKANYYRECEELKRTIHNQKVIIAQMEHEIQCKNRTIDYMTSQLSELISKNQSQTSAIGNLIDFD